MKSEMNLEQLIKTRRTINQFKTTAISNDLVQKAMDLSRWAPNHRLTLPWRYKVLSAGERGRLVDLAVELKRKKDPGFSGVKEAGLRSKQNAPSHWLLLAINKDPRPEVFWEDQATLACSVQIMSLFLWDHGVGTKWSTGGYSMHEKTYEILDIDPSTTHIMGVLFIGEPEVIPPAPSRG